MTVLEATGITKTFAGLRALSDARVRVEERQIVSIIGPNGAGKTTFFNCLSGFLQPDSGRVELAGQDMEGWSPARRARSGLGRTFQQGGLCASETVLANLLVAQDRSVSKWSPSSLLAAGSRGRQEEASRRDLAMQVLDILRMVDDADTVVSSLSYGHRKVLELGSALLAKPHIILLDEPAAGLGPDETDWLAGVIVDVRDHLGVSILLIEHHVPMVAKVSDHVFVLNFGEILAEGPPAAITRDPAVLTAYLGRSGTAESAGVTQ
ncbi:MAG: ABC transporter ATP-binding protein [Acidimicrobiales bacterium]|nr:ABC transporter ATP-binding protein [Acidimicrobiales bacterium]